MGRKPQAVIEVEKDLGKWGKNYATVQAIRDRAAQKVVPLITQTKSNRRAKEEEWMEDFRLYRCVEPDGSLYVGRANIFIPELKHQVESSVAKFQTGIFPNGDYVKVVPAIGTDAENAEKIKAAVKYELDYKNNLPSQMERFQRQKILYGTSVMKGEFIEEVATIYVRNAKGQPEEKVVPKFQGVRWKPVDLFHWYQFPETAEPCDAEIQFEEMFVEKSVLMAEPDKYTGLDEVQEVDAAINIWNWADTTRMVITNISTAMGMLPDSVFITECWMDFDIQPGKKVPCVITIANGAQVIRIQRNPYWHQQTPYVVGRYVKSCPHEFYGASLPESIRGLQYQMNDLCNQTMDSLTFSLNPIAIIDPGMAGDVSSFKLQPGAKWLGSPQGIQFANFTDVSSVGFQGMGQVRQMISQFSDDSLSIAPQLSGKVRTATQAQAVQSESNSNLRNMVLCDQYDVMIPICRMTHSMLQQFQTEEYQITLQGPDKASWITEKIAPKDLVGDLHWIWQGSDVNEQSAVRNQQLLAYTNMIMQSAQALQGQVDLPALIKLCGKEAFGIEADRIAEIFPDEMKSRTVDPELENMALVDLQDVVVNPGDIYEYHMQVHGEGLKKAKDQDEKIAFIKHMQKHETDKRAKDLLAQQQQQLAAVQAQNEQMGGQPGGGDGGPQGQRGYPGNPTQIGASPNIAQGMKGVSPNG